MLVVSAFLVNSVFNFALGLLVARFLGPVGFGQYALAAAVAVVINTLFLDWIRFAATRFYSDKTRQDDPAVRGTLDAIFILSCFGIVATAAVAIWVGVDFKLMLALAALAPAMGICNGLFDYHAALARARFDEKTFSVMIILKNVISLALMVGGAVWWPSPVVVAAGFVVSMLATVALVRRRLIDPGVNIAKPDWAKAGSFFSYGFPIILASMIFYIIPLWNRASVADDLGFAASGQFSLAYDIAIRVVQTVGSALDIILFQIALRAEGEEGMAKARDQLSANMGMVIAAIAAVVTGYWLVLPSFEVVLVPDAFRGSYATVTTILLPGLACFALTQFAVTPVFQLHKRTWPVIASAGLALAVNAALVLPLGAQATLADYARAQSLAYGLALVAATILALRLMKVLPKARDVLGTLVACAAMIAAVWPMRTMQPGLQPLALSAMAGGVAFAAVAILMNVGGARDMLKRRKTG